MSDASAERPWNETNPRSMQWTERAYELLLNDEIQAVVISRRGLMTAKLQGPCPYCEHFLEQHQNLSLVTLQPEYLADDDPDRTYRVDFVCDCAEYHPGRPPTSEAGCGIAFSLNLFVETPDSR